MFTALWCINLWIDIEIVLQKMKDSKENKRVFGRLARIWQNGEDSAGSSKLESDELRVQHGLDEASTPEEPKEKIWYDAR